MICIITAKGYSRRIPRKNIRKFRGKPMLSYALEVALKSDIFSYIYVATDDVNTFEVVDEFNSKLIQQRYKNKSTRLIRIIPIPDNFTNSETTTLEYVIESTRIIGYQGHFGILYPCCPLLVPTDLQKGHKKYLHFENKGQYLMSCCSGSLKDAGNFYFGKTDLFVDNLAIRGKYTIRHSLPEGRCIDINTWDDWRQAEVMHDNLNKDECGKNG